MNKLNSTNIFSINKKIKEINLAISKTKLSNIICLDVSKKFYFADCFIITSASSKQQAKSSAGRIKKQLLEVNIKSKIEGIHSDQWILIDIQDYIIHIFINEYRKYYDLEGLWKI